MHPDCNPGQGDAEAESGDVEAEAEESHARKDEAREREESSFRTGVEKREESSFRVDARASRPPLPPATGCEPLSIPSLATTLCTSCRDRCRVCSLPPALRVGPNRPFQVHDLYWRPPLPPATGCEPLSIPSLATTVCTSCRDRLLLVTCPPGNKLRARVCSLPPALRAGAREECLFRVDARASRPPPPPAAGYEH